MNVFSKMHKLQLLHILIKDQKTGSPCEVSKTIGVSRANLYRLIDELSSFNFNVKYSRTRSTFYYQNEVELSFKYNVDVIEDNDELRKFNGGCITFFVPSRILDGTNLSLHPYSAGYKE